MATRHALHETVERPGVGRELALAHVQIAFAIAEVGGGMQEPRAGGQPMSLRVFDPGTGEQALAHPGPLLAPGLVVALAAAQALADLVDLAHGGCPERGHLDRGHHPLRPHVAAGEVLEPVPNLLFVGCVHVCPVSLPISFPVNSCLLLFITVAAQFSLMPADLMRFAYLS